MRNVVFAINITVDGCCGHESVVADDELHEHFTGLMQDSDIEVFGRWPLRAMQVSASHS